MMTKDEILCTLKSAEPQLRASGVKRAAPFGSVARGEARPDSDIDIMLDIDPDQHEAIRDFIRDTTADTFSSDLRTLYAVTRALEIISQASRRLPMT